jgi:predicted homoserine dehydrogenase-like protein
MGLIGAGAMGKGLLYQSTVTPGVTCVAFCDRQVDRAVQAAQSLGIPYQVAESPDDLNDIIRRGKVAVCADGLWVAQCERLDVVIEASNAIGPAGRQAMTTLEHGKPLVLMNSEIDLIFGPVLAETARKHNVVCTSCDGDQYGVIKHLLDDLRAWGFAWVMAGNIKGFLDRSATPVSIAAEADLRHLDHRMCASYTDGTKLNIEMALIANACGMRTSRVGMAGPRMKHVREVFRCFDFDALWRDRQPCVDYILGAEPGGGVFVIGHSDHPYQRQMMAYYKMGPGPYYLFYRPYHLCHVEAMRTVVDAVAGKCLLKPDFGFRTNVYAYAKVDLKAGAVLDGMGGHAGYGQIENCADNQRDPGLPICLAEQVTLKRAISKGDKILLRDVAHDPQSYDFKLFAKSVKISDVLARRVRPGV